MQLSICMMVKNEEKNLKRCLDSLKPLRAKVKSELIIVDTGSTDGTVNIAKSYTDKVYFHPWNNNFSEMRNITISYAQGDWIMIIDADEELKEMTSIVDFFSHKKLINKFGVCLLKVTNFVNLTNKKDVSITYSPRLFRNDGFFHYEGRVHNQANWRGNALSLEDSILLHYGYDNENKELMQAKFERTSQLLKEELKDNPDNIYYHYQLAVSYAMHNEAENALAEIRIAYTIMMQKQELKQFFYLYSTYANYAFFNKEWEETEKICLEGIRLEQDYLDLYFTLARLYKMQRRNESAVKAYQKYLDLLGKLESLPIYRNPAVKLDTINNEIDALLDLCSLHFVAGDYLTTMEMGSEIYRKVTKKCSTEYSTLVLQMLEYYIRAGIKSQNYLKIHELYAKISEKEYLIYFQSLLEKQILTIPEDEQLKLRTLFATGEDLYSQLNRLTLDFKTKKLEGFELKLEKLTSEIDFNSEPEYYSQLFTYFISFKKSYHNFLKDVSKERMDKIFGYYFQAYPQESELTKDYLGNISIDGDLTHLRVQRYFIKNVLLHVNMDDEVYDELFKHYIHVGVLYVHLLYNKNIIQSHEWSDLNSEDRFLLQMNEANKLRNQGNYHRAVKLLKNALKTNPQFSKGIKVMTEEIGTSARAPQNDLVRYAHQVKSNIETLINKDELEDASSLIGELEQIMGTDAEILSMKAVILLKRQDTNEAEKLLEDATVQYPDNFDLVYNLASTYELREEYKEAIKCYRQARQLCPDQNLILGIDNHMEDLEADMKKV